MFTIEALSDGDHEAPGSCLKVNCKRQSLLQMVHKCCHWTQATQPENKPKLNFARDFQGREAVCKKCSLLGKAGEKFVRSKIRTLIPPAQCHFTLPLSYSCVVLKKQSSLFIVSEQSRHVRALELEWPSKITERVKHHLSVMENAAEKKRGNPSLSGRAVGQKNIKPAGDRQQITLRPSTVTYFENCRKKLEEEGLKIFEDKTVAPQIKTLSGLMNFIAEHCKITLTKSLSMFPVFPCNTLPIDSNVCRWLQCWWGGQVQHQ